MPRAITRREIHGSTIRQIGRIEYPDGSGRILQSVALPRLTYIVRRWDDGSARTFWVVDGQTVEGIDHAIEELNRPPVLSDEELEVLERVPAEWTAPSDLRDLVAGDLPLEARAPRIRILRTLAGKGMIEVEDNRIRRSDEDFQ